MRLPDVCCVSISGYQEPGSPTLTHLKLWLDRQVWLAQYRIGEKVLEGISDVKVKHFAAEARTLDAAGMLEIEPRKRRTLTASLLRVQLARVSDDLAEMLIKRLSSLDYALWKSRSPSTWSQFICSISCAILNTG